MATKLERWSLALGLVMAAVGLLVGNLAQPSPTVVWVLVVCLMAEIGGMAVAIASALGRGLPELIRPRETHAGEMDQDFASWVRLIDKLRAFPKEQREARLRFVSQLRQRMTERMGFLYGGIQRLGVLPVVVAAYLQFRHWEWGDWAGAFDVNLVSGLLILTMLLLYGTGWLLVSMRDRLDSYMSLLEDSLEE